MAPAADPAVEEAEEGGADQVDADGIAAFVGDAVVVGGVDGDIVTEQQGGQRARHEGSLNKTAKEAGGFLALFEGNGRPIQHPADQEGGGDDQTETDNDLEATAGGSEGRVGGH